VGFNPRGALQKKLYNTTSFQYAYPMSGLNPNAWHNFYLCVGGTYGTWLRGDPRGFRSYQHRMHVEGDYKNPPPPGVFTPIFEYSLKTLKYPPAKLTQTQRQILCQSMIQRLLDDLCEPITLAIHENHFHLLARFKSMQMDQRHQHNNSIIHDGRDPAPRYYLGRARQAGTHALTQHDLKPQGPIWGKRPSCKPIQSRDHQLKVARYIKEHVKQSAAVWHIKLGFLFDVHDFPGDSSPRALMCDAGTTCKTCVSAPSEYRILK
jgi:hypothetical protein